MYVSLSLFPPPIALVPCNSSTSPHNSHKDSSSDSLAFAPDNMQGHVPTHEDVALATLYSTSPSDVPCKKHKEEVSSFPKERRGEDQWRWMCKGEGMWRDGERKRWGGRRRGATLESRTDVREVNFVSITRTTRPSIACCLWQRQCAIPSHLCCPNASHLLTRIESDGRPTSIRRPSTDGTAVALHSTNLVINTCMSIKAEWPWIT